jgi:hypothetical protein
MTITAEQIRAAFPVDYRDRAWEGDNIDIYDYDLIAPLYGLPVLYSWTENSYQGDAFFILQGDDGRLGLLMYGYGSCSGCDSLQACTTTQDVADLANQMFADTRWFDDKDAMRAYIDSDDAKLYSWWTSDRGIITAIRNWIDGNVNADEEGRRL